jgi:hypothetical protein
MFSRDPKRFLADSSALVGASGKPACAPFRRWIGTKVTSDAPRSSSERLLTVQNWPGEVLWKRPADTAACIAKMEDGRTHLTHKAERAFDLNYSTLMAVTLGAVDSGETTMHCVREKLYGTVGQGRSSEYLTTWRSLWRGSTRQKAQIGTPRAMSQRNSKLGSELAGVAKTAVLLRTEM